MEEYALSYYKKYFTDDADKLFSGMLLKQYFVYLDDGDIEEVQ